MVAEEHRTGLYVAVSVYFGLLIVATFWAYRRTETMKHEGVNDALSAHYLGGRSFGPLLTAGTVFASVFSGYTVIGIPNEAFRLGWYALRWIPTLFAAVLGYMGVSLRLRKASLLRNHQSPVDFITDRYQSQVLRYSTLYLQVLPNIIYLAAQIIAIKSTFNSIFGLDPDTAYPVIVIMVAILIFEWLGGLSSVALTDCVQAIVMIASFVIIPCVTLKQFGGWHELDPETFPKPQLYQTMSKEAQWQFWQFSIVNVCFFTLPHLVQRIYSAKDLPSLKAGFAALTLGPWFTGLVSVFLGTVAVGVLVNDDGTPQNPSSPFAAILEVLMDVGGFPKGAAIVCITAALAAIMSTADSILIAISQLVTTEIIYPLKPQATPNEMAWYGRIVSMFSVIFSLLIGLYWDEGLTDLASIQFPLSAQAGPVFLFGLFSTNQKTDVHPWCLAIGAVSASIYVFSIYFSYVKDNKDALPIDPGVTGFLLNIAITVGLEAIRRAVGSETLKFNATGTTKLLYPDRPQWDVPKLSRFGDNILTPQLLWKSMEGVNEAMTNFWFVGFILFAISMATPMTAEYEPPLTDGVFSYAPAVFNGLPWWAFKIILMCIVPTVGLLGAIYFYPDDFPMKDEEVIETEGIDPNLVELTPQEMGRRSMYDEQNELIHRRRSSISATMEELGIAIAANDDKPGAMTRRASTPSQMKLVSLVSGRNMETFAEGDALVVDDSSLNPKTAHLDGVEEPRD